MLANFNMGQTANTMVTETCATTICKPGDQELKYVYRISSATGKFAEVSFKNKGPCKNKSLYGTITTKISNNRGKEKWKLRLPFCILTKTFSESQILSILSCYRQEFKCNKTLKLAYRKTPLKWLAHCIRMENDTVDLSVGGRWFYP